jgi:hypothetical protein
MTRDSEQSLVNSEQLKTFYQVAHVTPYALRFPLLYLQSSVFFPFSHTQPTQLTQPPLPASFTLHGFPRFAGHALNAVCRGAWGQVLNYQFFQLCL